MNKWSIILVCVVLIAFLSMVHIAMVESEVTPMRELHMVEVEGKVAPRLYRVFVPASANPGKTDQTMTIKLCSDGDDLPLKAGMVMRVFQYRQRIDCMLIDGDTFVGYLRDAQDNVVDKFGNKLFFKGD